MAGYVYRGTRAGLDLFDVPPRQPGRGGRRRGVGVKPCGTYPAYKRHKKYGEDACQPCKIAHRKYQAEMKAKQRKS